MSTVVYEFKNIDNIRQRKYLYQFVKNRRMTDIYHSHDFYELIWFLNGSGTKKINEDVITIEKNTIVLLRPGDRHSFISQSENIEVISLSVKKEEFELFSNAYDLLLLKLIESSKSPICFMSSCTSILDACHKAPQDVTEYDCKLLLSCFLSSYILHTGCLKNTCELPPMLNYAIDEMKKPENLKQGISAFTSLSHYSHSHLARLIKQHLGMSLKQYINELRLESAYNDIILTNESIELISENLGFSSFSHFNKIFKARFSVTPAALRKSNGVWTA